MTSGPGRINHVNYSACLFSKDEELFKKTAVKVSKTAKVGVDLPQKELQERGGNWVQVHTTQGKAQTLAQSILAKTRDNQDGRDACKRVIIADVQQEGVSLNPKEKKEFRQTINSEISKDLVKKGLERKSLTLEDTRELLKFVGESKEKIDNTTFHELRAQVIRKLCDQIPTLNPIGREASSKALYAAEKGLHLGNLHTIKDSAMRKMCEDIDKEIGQTLEGYFDYGLTPDFIDEYLSAIADAVKLVNTAGKYIEQAPQERKQVLSSTSKILQGVLSPGKKRGWFGGVNSNFETAKTQVVFYEKQLSLMMDVAFLKRAHPRNVKDYKNLERDLKNAKDINQLTEIGLRLEKLKKSSDVSSDVLDLPDLGQIQDDALSYEFEELNGGNSFKGKQLELIEQVELLKKSDFRDKEDWDSFLRELKNAKDLDQLEGIAYRLNARVDELSD